MLYLGQECVFFVSNGPEMDPRGGGGESEKADFLMMQLIMCIGDVNRSPDT